MTWFCRRKFQQLRQHRRILCRLSSCRWTDLLRRSRKRDRNSRKLTSFGCYALVTAKRPAPLKSPESTAPIFTTCLKNTTSSSPSSSDLTKPNSLGKLRAISRMGVELGRSALQGFLQQVHFRTKSSPIAFV